MSLMLYSNICCGAAVAHLIASNRLDLLSSQTTIEFVKDQRRLSINNISNMIMVVDMNGNSDIVYETIGALLRFHLE